MGGQADRENGFSVLAKLTGLRKEMEQKKSGVDSNGQAHTRLTVNIHQDADVGAPHSVVDLAGYGLGEEGVVCRGHKNALPGTLQENATLCPPVNHSRNSRPARHTRMCVGLDV